MNSNTNYTVIRCEIFINNNGKEETKTVDIKLFPDQANGNTALMETLCQNRLLFQDLSSIGPIKRIIDCICQNTVEKKSEKLSRFGIQINMNGFCNILKEREVYLLSQNEQGQNVLHLAINVFKNYPNRLLFIYTLIEVLKPYLSFYSWHYLCFVQINNPCTVKKFITRRFNRRVCSIYPHVSYIQSMDMTDMQSNYSNLKFGRGMTPFQNMYYMRYPMIIGAFNNNHVKYSTEQRCIEALSVYQGWKYSEDMTEEQKMNESIFLRKLHVAQFALQQICRSQTEPKNSNLITIWGRSAQTFFDAPLGQSSKPVFHFSNELEPLNNILETILERLFQPNSQFMPEAVQINYAFDKQKQIFTQICEVVKEVLNEKNYRIPESLTPEDIQITIDKADEESSELDPELEELANIECPQEQKNDEKHYPSLYITQISDIPHDENNITKFENDVQAISEMFKENGNQLMKKQNDRDPTLMVNIPEFLIWLCGPYSEVSWQEMADILANGAVIFSLRVWIQQAIDNDVKWRLPIPSNLRFDQTQKYLDVNVFGFLIYIGFPLVLALDALSVKNSTADNFGMMLCNSTFAKHFELLNRSNFLLSKTDINSPSIAYVMLLIYKQCRNREVDRLNAEFLLYFANTTNEFKAVHQKNVFNFQQTCVRSYFFDDLDHEQAFQRHFEMRSKLKQEEEEKFEKALRDATAQCQEYVDAYNSEQNRFIKKSIPNQRYIKKAVIDEFVLELLRGSVQVQFDPNDHIHMNIILSIKYATNAEIAQQEEQNFARRQNAQNYQNYQQRPYQQRPYQNHGNGNGNGRNQQHNGNGKRSPYNRNQRQ